jgi:predicted nucleic acid-binding protein
VTETDKALNNVVDSSGWIEYFTESPNATFFAPAIENTARLVVPSVSILEVFKWVLRKHGENAALKTAGVMQQGRVTNLDSAVALSAAKLGAELRLPLADSIIYATAQNYNATLWTQDADFKELAKVHYRPKSPIPT